MSLRITCPQSFGAFQVEILIAIFTNFEKHLDALNCVIAFDHVPMGISYTSHEVVLFYRKMHSAKAGSSGYVIRFSK